MLRDRAIEHAANGRTAEIRRCDAEADDAAGEDIHRDKDPVSLEQDRFATKAVDAPEAVLSLPDDGKQRRTITTWSRAVVLDEDAPDDIFIDFDTESAGDLLGNFPATEAGVSPLHLDDRVYQFF
jgi:hypothetical protein